MMHDEHIFTEITGLSKQVLKVAIGMGKQNTPFSIEVGMSKNCDIVI